MSGIADSTSVPSSIRSSFTRYFEVEENRQNIASVVYGIFTSVIGAGVITASLTVFPSVVCFIAGTVALSVGIKTVINSTEEVVLAALADA